MSEDDLNHYILMNAMVLFFCAIIPLGDNMIKIDKTFFNTKTDRKKTNSVKHDMKPKGKVPDNLIPMWVADMDFKVPPQVEEELVKTSRHGIFGYSYTDEEYDSLVVSWYKTRFGWDIKPDWILKTPGVMFAIGSVIRALTDKNDSVMILEPVYYPFAKITIGNDRNLVISNLKLDNNRYVIDFEDFEHKVVKHKAKLLLLCSPHNPVGRVWTKEELLEIARVCLKYGVIIVSDEIHSDFVYKGYRHIPIASLSEEILNSTITCTSPSKTFNIAGLQVSNIVIENQDLRRKVWKACLQTGYSSLNTMAICATKAAYKYGHLWLDALMDYLEDNVNLVQNVLCSKSGITLIRPEATYLMWLDCRNMNLDQDNLDSFFISKLGLWLSSGSIFGESGNGFMRMNIATQRSVLHEALHRIDMEIQ